MDTAKNSLKDIVGDRAYAEIRSFVCKVNTISDVRSGARILFDYGIIALCIWGSIKSDSILIYTLALIIIAGRQHGLMILIHEAVHGLLFSSPKLNDAAAEIFCCLPLGVYFQGYKWNHLTHHQFLNSNKDPDWARKAQSGWIFPMSIRRFTLFFLRESFYRLPKSRLLRIKNMFLGKRSSKQYQFGVWFFLIAQFLILYKMGWLIEYVIFWIVPLWFIVPGIFTIRSLSEHFALPYKSELTDSRDIRANWINLIFIPHHASYHLTHHLFPYAPSYNLRKISEFLQKNSQFSEGAMYSDGYVYGKNSLLKQLLNRR